MSLVESAEILLHLLVLSGVARLLLLLGEAGCPRDDAIEAGFELLRSKQGRDAMWKMVGGLNGEMHANLDARERASPWITYRALLAFKRFGLWTAGSTA